VKLPHADRAIIDMRKLVDYCLSAEHPRGRHKARVFESKLGFRAENAFELREALLIAVLEGEASLGERDAYGQRYFVDLDVGGPKGNARVRTAWIVRIGEDIPRLTSCYVQ
jgi:hypothetical protein